MSAMFYIDVHCHLARQELQDQVDKLICEALENNVKIMIVSVQSELEFRNAMKLKEKYPLTIFLTLGQELTDFTIDTFTKLTKNIEKLIREKIVVGIGEIGLDYSKVKDPILRNIAKAILEKWLSLASKLDIPVIVHTHRAHRDSIEILKSFSLKKVVLHAFSGGTETAKKAAEEGWYFSIPPSIMHSKQKQKLVQALELDNLLLESDCPELGPSYGEPSKPVHVRLVAEKIAELKKVPVDEVVRQCTVNALRLFRLEDVVRENVELFGELFSS